MHRLRFSSRSKSSLAFSQTPTLSPMPLKYLLVLDFEATCSNDSSILKKNIEIIEFPTLLYSLNERALVKTVPGRPSVPPQFHEYVRPVIHPTLTTFCTELTGIEQSTVSQADPFPAVWARFLDWLRTIGVFDEPESYAFLTCGKWDLDVALPIELRRMQQSAPSVCDPAKVINVKKEFSSVFKLNKDRGMGKPAKNSQNSRSFSLILI